MSFLHSLNGLIKGYGDYWKHGRINMNKPKEEQQKPVRIKFEDLPYERLVGKYWDNHPEPEWLDGIIRQIKQKYPEKLDQFISDNRDKLLSEYLQYDIDGDEKHRDLKGIVYAIANGEYESGQ